MNGQPAYVIGIDGGGTKTATQLADLNGRVLAESLGGPSNFQIVGVEESARTILHLIETCCLAVRCTISEIGSVVAGLTGAGRETDQRRMAEGLQNVAQGRGMYLQDVSIESDARIALEGAFLGNSGIVLIGGTGSIAFAKDGRGRILRSGGWGRLIGDEGGGYNIGREAFRAVAKMLDGRGKKTLLAKFFAAQFGLKTQEAIIRGVYKEEFDLASAAPLVFRAAVEKDSVANMILQQAAAELVDAIRAVMKGIQVGSKSSRKKIPLVCVGGLLDSQNVYTKKLKALIRKELLKVSVEMPAASPVHGAVLMAVARMKAISKNKETAKVH